MFKKNLLKTVLVAAATFMLTSMSASAATKTVEFTLEKGYLDCEFNIKVKNPKEGKNYSYSVIHPDGRKEKLNASVDGVATYKTESAEGGVWQVVVDDGDHANEDPESIGEVNVSVKADASTSSETGEQEIEVAKEINGLSIYYKDDAVVVEWSDETVGDVNVSVIDSKTLQSFYNDTVLQKDKHVEVELPESTTEITVGVVPAISQNISGAGQQFTKFVENNPDAIISLPEITYTNEPLFAYEATLGQQYDLAYYINDKLVATEEDVQPGTHELTIPLIEGYNDIKVYVVDEDGNMRSTATTTTLDTVPPTLMVQNDFNGLTTDKDSIEFVGKVEDYNTLTFNNSEVEPDYDGQFKIPASLEIGENRFQILATDLAGNESEYTATVTRFVEEKKEIPWDKVIISFIMVVLLVYIFISKRKQRLEKSEDEYESKISWKDMFHRKRMSVDKGLILDILYVVLPVVIAFVFFKYIIVLGACESGSMEPTIMTGDVTVSNGLAYFNREPQRGDIIYFKNEQTKGDVYVKRIVGMPGEHVSFKDGDVYINGIKCKEEYIPENVVTNCDKEFDVPAGEYFAMGDNRENSYDGRYWDDPYVSMDEIGGRVIANLDVSFIFKFFKVEE